MTESGRKRFIINIVYLLFAAAVAYLAVKYLLRWLLPFLLAMLAARTIEPIVRFLCRRLRWKRAFAAFVVSVLILAAAAGMAVLAVSRGIFEVSAFLRQLPGMLSGMTGTFSSLRDKVYGFIVAAPPNVQDYLRSALSGVGEWSAKLPGELTGKLFGVLPAVMSNAPRIVLTVFTFAISLIFASASYPDITAFFMRQIPEEKRVSARRIKDDLFSVMGKWLRAQAILCAVTFAQLTAAFLIMRIDYAVLLALLTALIDMLPVLGTGTVLLPWALVSIISGNTGRAIMLAVTYAVVTAVRSCAEPKLVGGQVGLPSIAALTAMYAGFSAAGVAGMVLAPLALMCVKQLCESGHIKLWR